MNRKLTLNIDDSIIEFAHKYAKETRQSISNIVESYFSDIQSFQSSGDFSPKTSSLYGILQKTPLPDKKQMKQEFHEKSID